MSGLEDVIGDEVLQLLDQQRRRRWAIERLQRAFTMELHEPHAFRGLARRYTGLALMDLYPKGLPLPFGWCIIRYYEHDWVLVMPTWLGWPLFAWGRRWRLFRVAKRLGFWQMPGDARLWTDGHLTAPRWLRAIAWCFVNDCDVYPG